MSSLSEKFHSVWGNDSQSKDDCLLEEGSEESKAIVLYNNSHSYEALPNPSETLVVEEQDQECYEGYYNYDGDDDKYPDLTHTLFDSEDLDLGGSVIDLVKNSKEEAGKEFKLEDEIDFAADLFIMKFRRQMVLQKQESFKRKREMQEKGAWSWSLIWLVIYLSCLAQQPKLNPVISLFHGFYNKGETN